MYSSFLGPTDVIFLSLSSRLSPYLSLSLLFSNGGVLCYVMLCYVMLCYVMLCYVTLLLCVSEIVPEDDWATCVIGGVFLAVDSRIPSLRPSSSA